MTIEHKAAQPGYKPAKAVVSLLITLILAASFPAILWGEEPSEPKTSSTAASTPVATPAKSDSIENSVVRIYTTARYPDVYKPWMKQTPAEMTGSGAIIEGNRILTCAHMVLYASQVQIQANQSSERLNATVEAIAPGMDLAVLKMEDNKFFDTHQPLARAVALPAIGDGVLAYGYPRGGDGLSITKGIVSRIEFVAYNRPASGLRIQIDAAINPGNSGGPAVGGGKMIGLAFSQLGGAQNIGYIIPCEEIELFLKSINASGYSGKWFMFDSTQGLANPGMRAYLKLDEGVKGVMVYRPESIELDYPLKERDVITHIGDVPLDNEGMIQVGPDLRVQYKYMVQKVAHDGKVPLTVRRGSEAKEIKIELPLARRRSEVVPDLDNDYPSYFVCGPLTFTDATDAFVSGFSSGGRLVSLAASGSPLVKRLGDRPAFDGERLVVVSTTFPHKLTRGYRSPAYQAISTINGVKVRNLLHLVEVLRDLTDEFVVIKFDSQVAETMVLPRKEMLAVTDDVLSDNSIRSQGSQDVMAVWNAKKPR